MEFASSGDLKTVIKNKLKSEEYFNEDKIWNWLIQITSAINYIHSKKIIHRDIKTENIFLSLEENVKIGDFGISRSLNNTSDFAQTNVGTPFYFSPEICKGEKYNHKSDIWMLGCFLYELCSFRTAFDDNDSKSINILINNILNKEPDYTIISERYSEELVKLIKDLIKKNPEDRPEIDEITSRINMRFNININTGLKATTNKDLDITTNSLKMIDKNKLKIEVEDQDQDQDSIDSACSPLKDNCSSLFKSKIFQQTESNFLNKTNKYTPNYSKKDMTKIMKNMKISPMNINKELVETVSERTLELHNNCNNQNSLNDQRRSSNTTTNSSSTSHTGFDNYRKIPKPVASKSSFKDKHFKQISINISSMQSPEHKATYHIDNIEKIQNIEFPQLQIQNNLHVLKTPTPTNQIPNCKISPKLPPKETPYSTKVGKQRTTKSYTDNIARSEVSRYELIKQFLIERYGKSKFNLMYETVQRNNYVIEEQKIMDIVKEDYKIAVNYMSYLINLKNN